ncbi:hypothetical protein A2U01_0108926 [Trifolium medium]|uniref:Uncharacterized protein n=1 Tax=Trifolium medium TaxID=97028 RepID=A0A392VJP0_9FABA|nr:hypothetical protein [Trifolium medium]
MARCAPLLKRVEIALPIARRTGKNGASRQSVRRKAVELRPIARRAWEDGALRQSA